MFNLDPLSIKEGPPTKSKRQLKIISAKAKRNQTPATLNEKIMEAFPSGSSSRRVQKAKREEKKRKNKSEVQSPRKRQRIDGSSTKSPSKWSTDDIPVMPMVTPESRAARKGAGARVLYQNVDSDVESVASFASTINLDTTFNENGIRVPTRKLKKWSKRKRKVSTGQLNVSMESTATAADEPWTMKDVVRTIPNNVKTLRSIQRACLGCAMVKDINQFYHQGCSNCEKFVQMKGCWQNIERCSSAKYVGLIALMNPTASEIGFINNIDTSFVVPGIYAASVSGNLPKKVIERMKKEGILFKKKFNESDYPDAGLNADADGSDPIMKIMSREDAVDIVKAICPQTPSLNTSFGSFVSKIRRSRRQKNESFSTTSKSFASNGDISRNDENSSNMANNVSILDTIIGTMDADYDRTLLSIYKENNELPAIKRRVVEKPFAGQTSILLLKPEAAEMYLKHKSRHF